MGTTFCIEALDEAFARHGHNVFVERLWRSIKYEEVYLHAYDSVSLARAGIARCVEFYNTLRPK